MAPESAKTETVERRRISAHIPGRRSAKAMHLKVSRDAVVVDLSDGRTVSVPVGWYPRLEHATAAERKRWRLIGDGRGIHWVDSDEDISVRALLEGRASGETQQSLKRWLKQRRQHGCLSEVCKHRRRTRVMSAENSVCRLLRKGQI
jgi:hypothetical protein